VKVGAVRALKTQAPRDLLRAPPLVEPFLNHAPKLDVERDTMVLRAWPASEHPLLRGVRSILTRRFSVASNLTAYRRNAPAKLGSDRPSRTAGTNTIGDHEPFLV